MLLLAWAPGAWLGAQQAAPRGAPGTAVAFQPGDLRYLIPGTVVDLSRDAAGRILYCTTQGEVGRFTPGGTRTVLATAASGPFPNALRAVAETPLGDVALLDSAGDVRVLSQATTPAALVYHDQFMIQDPTDLIVDTRGDFVIASATPTPNVRAMNWVSADGVRWGYYLVRHAPVQLAHDPLSGGIVIADATSGGNLQLVQAGSATRATSALDTTTHPGISAAASDGDLAAEADGDLYWIAGGSVYRRARATNTTTLFAGGYGPLHGIAIGAASGLVPSGGGWSLYLAEGSNPTVVRELGGVDQPGAVIANDQGFVPGRGAKVNVTFGFQAFELAADNAGRLLLGGSNFGTTHWVKRVTLTGTPSIAPLCSSADGLAGIVEGLCVAPDDSIYALARTGVIQRITEGPLALATVFADAGGQVTAGKDLALDVDGSLYVACRESWGFGKVLRVSGGAASLLAFTDESRGLAADPVGGMYVSQWRNTGFAGTVERLHFADNSLETQPGFAGMNYTNDSVWGDGDLCVDANGSVYTISEDDWSLVRYDPALDGFVRLGSGYLNHPSGLAIAPSTAGSGSTTGWSLYVAEFDNLWEKVSVQAPASTLVDASLGLALGPHGARSVAAAPDPRFGKPSVLAPAPHGVYVGTRAGWVLAIDPASGAVEPVAGPEDGLRGEIALLAPLPHGTGLVAVNRMGQRFELGARGVRELDRVTPELAPLLERALLAPRRTFERRDPLTGAGELLVLDGWVLWRLAPGPR